MKKLMLTLALVLTAALNANAQLLYKISGNGLEKPIWLPYRSPTAFRD